jgi:tripartite-type tricarboxylate transporter receptor subunit TctC
MSSWVAAVVPARTPPAIVNILYEAIRSAVDDPATKATLAKIGNLPMLNPQQFAAKIKAETEVNAEIIKRANIQLGD